MIDDSYQKHLTIQNFKEKSIAIVIYLQLKENLKASVQLEL